MIRINQEIIISSLLAFGFENVDQNLYNYVLGKLTVDNNELKLFQFFDEPFCYYFEEIIAYDEKGFHLKKGLTLDSIYPVNCGAPIRLMLNTRTELMNYLRTLDFRGYVFNKICSFGTNDLDNMYSNFCSKEREIIADMFGIDDSINILEKAASLAGIELPEVAVINMNDSKNHKDEEKPLTRLYIPRKDL